MFNEAIARVLEDHDCAEPAAWDALEALRSEGWNVVKGNPKTWRYCPICGRRNREAAVPEIVAEMGDHLADFTFCSPSNCDAWTVTATFDHSTRQWMPVESVADAR